MWFTAGSGGEPIMMLHLALLIFRLTSEDEVLILGGLKTTPHGNGIGFRRKKEAACNVVRCPQSSSESFSLFCPSFPRLDREHYLKSMELRQTSPVQCSLVRPSL
jgi:hypothetical protein